MGRERSDNQVILLQDIPIRNYSRDINLKEKRKGGGSGRKNNNEKRGSNCGLFVDVDNLSGEGVRKWFMAR